jgi:hypothetical protein
MDKGMTEKVSTPLPSFLHSFPLETNCGVLWEIIARIS